MMSEKNISELVSAVLLVMEECQGIGKNATIGTWSYQYKWVSDKDVKLKIWWSMKKNWLVMLPIEINTKDVVVTHKDNKTSYYTEVNTKYRLMHTSGSWIDLAWYGQAIDTQDKWAWKATTYAMKYMLLYTFMVATGHIDDTDNHHSEDILQPKKEIKEDDFWF